MVLSEAIEDYRTYARHALGHAVTTHHSYISWQRNFAGWLAEQSLPDPPIGEITPALVRRYSYTLTGRKLRPRTIRGALHALRSLFAYLVAQGVLAESPADEVKLPKKDAATRFLLADEELIRLLEAAERQASDFRCVRDRALLAVLIFCGLRRQELLDLTVAAIHLEDGSLLVQQGKGQKSRTIYLCSEAIGALREWLAFRSRRQYRHGYLFVGTDGRRLGETGLHALMQDIKAAAGLKGDPRVQPHSIRHAAATRLMRNGADLRSIQTWLGHSQLQTTAIYLHTDEQQVRKIAPLAGLRPAVDPPAPPPASDRPALHRAAFYRSRRASR